MTQAHISTVQGTLPTWAPPIGSTVHIRTDGRRKTAIPHTIAEYRQVEQGNWVFKAYDYMGWSYCDKIDTLQGTVR